MVAHDLGRALAEGQLEIWMAELSKIIKAGGPELLEDWNARPRADSFATLAVCGALLVSIDWVIAHSRLRGGHPLATMREFERSILHPMGLGFQFPELREY